MRQITYTSDETYFVAGRNIEDAVRRMEADGEVRQGTPLRAWDKLSYWDREEHSSEYEVFEFRVTQRITKVTPPYTQ